MSDLAWLYWNPDRVVVTLPFINHPIVWYGVWFVLGFIFAYICLIPMIQKKLHNHSRQEAMAILDKLTWLVVCGTIVGARLGHVFFYDWDYIKNDPIEIFKVWNGGLASHGGTVGVIIALFVFRLLNRKKYPEITFICLLDLLAVPTAFAACCIRIGNFFNQEILGVASNVPWAIIFGSPADGSPIMPRHPVQLYEAASYLVTFILLFSLWYKKENLKDGLLIGLFFVLVFSSRFFIEFLKLPQSPNEVGAFIKTGQWLSVPFILVGFGFILYSMKATKSNQRIA